MNEPAYAAVAQRQLDAYNRRDTDAFVNCYAEDVVVHYLSTTDPVMQGRAAFRQSYAAMFAKSPQLHCELVHRAVQPPFVIDEERVTGHSGRTGVVRALAIYLVQENIIKKVWFAK